MLWIAQLALRFPGEEGKFRTDSAQRYARALGYEKRTFLVSYQLMCYQHQVLENCKLTSDLRFLYRFLDNRAATAVSRPARPSLPRAFDKLTGADGYDIYACLTQEGHRNFATSIAPRTTGTRSLMSDPVKLRMIVVWKSDEGANRRAL